MNNLDINGGVELDARHLRAVELIVMGIAY